MTLTAPRYPSSFQNGGAASIQNAGNNQYTWAQDNVATHKLIKDTVVNGSTGGALYTTATVTLAAVTGSGATATATIAPITVGNIIVRKGGSGYTSAPTVAISGGHGATATAVINNGVVTSILVTAAGSGYTSVPNVTFSGGGGTGAVAAANLIGGNITGFTVTGAGSGYVSAPVVTITGDGQGADAVAVISGGAVTAVNLVPSEYPTDAMYGLDQYANQTNTIGDFTTILAQAATEITAMQSAISALVGASDPNAINLAANEKAIKVSGIQDDLRLAIYRMRQLTLEFNNLAAIGSLGTSRYPSGWDRGY